MVYHDPFRRLVFSGTLYTTEQWSCGLTLAHVGLGDGTQPSSVSAPIIAAAETFFGKSFIGPDAALTTIKYNMIDVHGKYADTTLSTRWDASTPLPGGGTVHAWPQISLAVSLMTAHARGLAHTGRFYLPEFVAATDSSGRITEGQAEAIAADVTTFLNAVNDDNSDYRVAIVSQVAAGAQNNVTHVRVGRVVDTIRSRRNKLVEDYYTDVALVG